MAKFFCNKCVYETNSKQNYDNHNESKRHCQTVEFKLKCSCTKGFHTPSGLAKHKKKCKKIISKTIVIDTSFFNSTVIEIKEKLEEIIKLQKDKIEQDKIQQDKIEQDKIKHKPEYIYLLQEREFVESNRPIYKIGKTKQENISRVKQYPKGSILLYQTICSDCDKLENDLKKMFNEKYVRHLEIGNEYFEGHYNDMINDIFTLTK